MLFNELRTQLLLIGTNKVDIKIMLDFSICFIKVTISLSNITVYVFPLIKVTILTTELELRARFDKSTNGLIRG